MVAKVIVALKNSVSQKSCTKNRIQTKLTKNTNDVPKTKSKILLNLKFFIKTEQIKLYLSIFHFVLCNYLMKFVFITSSCSGGKIPAFAPASLHLR